MTTLHWQVREYAHQLRQDGRLTILTLLMLHANVRLRCWPSIRTLVRESGWSTASVTAAKQWLLDHTAIELVPYHLRVDQERQLPIRQHVYQLTGVLHIDGKEVPYLYLPKAEVLPTEISVGEMEGIPELLDPSIFYEIHRSEDDIPF